MNELTKMIERVRALIALSESTTSEQEAAAARTAADKLIQTYRLDAAMLEAAGQQPPEQLVSKVVNQGGRRTGFREVILSALSVQYGCAWYLSSGRILSKGHCEYTVVGRESDVQIVDYMFQYIESSCLHIGKVASEGKGRGFGKAWQSGFADGVAAQFRELNTLLRAQANTSVALVVLDKRGEESKRYMNSLIGTKKAAPVSGGKSYTGRAAGFQEGQRLNVNSPMGTGKTTPKLSA